MAIKTVGVIGCGLMGHGIAQVAAQAGYDVLVRESDAGALEKGMSRIQRSLAKLVEKQKLAQADAEAAWGRLRATPELDDLDDCDLIVEAIVENIDIKKTLFAELSAICKDTVIYASNTSSFAIAEMAEPSGHPDRFVGMHFFNPVQLMQLVEVVRTDWTSPDVFAEARAFAESLGKVPISAKDTPGFIVNRLLVPYMCEAIEMVERGDATPADIDTGMTLGTGYPMGPFTLLDYVGLDTTLSIVKGWHARFPKNPTFKVPRLLEDKVAAGKLGRKTGEGFYKWDGDKRA